MRSYGAVTFLLACCLAAGCQEDNAKFKPDKSVDHALVNTLNNIGVENAIIAQHTLYSYHFVANGAELNDLGKRDLGVLARHFVQHPGILDVQRGDATEDLYQKRVTFAVSGFQAAGVDTSRIVIAEGMPGGSGMPSEHVEIILWGPVQNPMTPKSDAMGRITEP
jgi:hypothetical protein